MYLPAFAAVVFAIISTCSADGHGGNELTCEESKGWFKGWDKCYKIFHGDHIRSYARAEEMCESYGSRLVTIQDQPESDLIGRKFTEMGASTDSYYIGLAKRKTDACATCTELRWSNGMVATETEGFWSDEQPDDSNGGCVYARKNSEDYIYDRPYTFSYGNCMILRAFICEKMAAPEDTFFCFSKGYVNSINVCDGQTDCEDGSDELNCTSNCRYYHSGDQGTLGPLIYRDAMTCTWAIETSPGTNAVVQFDNFNTEYNADFVTVMTGSFDESRAMIVGRISGNLGKQTFRSYNNKIFVKFSSDSSVSNTGSINGFTGTYGALKDNAGQKVTLTAEDNPKEYSIQTFDHGNINTFLGQRDYIIVISTQNNYQFGQMITLEILDLKLSDGDIVMFFDDESPQEKTLSKSCNDEEQCDNSKVVYSTDKKLSILLRTSKMVTDEMSFRFRYMQGCFYETTDVWGTIYTPGYTGNINYTNAVSCEWKISTTVPITLYFDSNSRLQSNDHNRDVNGDFLKIYENGQMYEGSPSRGYSTNQFAGQTFNLDSGVTRLQFDSSVTRSEKGFRATWSPACPDPYYDENTIISPSPLNRNYRAQTTVSCKLGYAFQQEQIPTGQTSVTIECGYKGVWKNYRQVPRCTPRYCGDVPVSTNGYVVSSTGTVYGSKVTYQCNPGTVASGNLEITCRSDGTWESPPTCSAGGCPSGVVSEIIPNGEGELKFGDGTSIGTIYEYKCNAGYEMVGQPYIICMDDAKWSQDGAPTCKLLTCLLPSIKNAFYNGYTAGTLVNVGVDIAVTCNNGYEFATNSAQRIRCNSDRTLSTLPECVDTDECTDDTICEVNCHNTDGGYYCSCNTGYTLSTFNSRTCIDVNECNGNHNCDGTCINEQGSYRCECSAPYVLYTADLVSNYAIPRDAGERGDLPTDTYHIDHSCVLLSCETPVQSIQNGKILTKRKYHRYGDHIEYNCDIGYIPRRIVRFCGFDGQWSGSEPVCQAATCSETVPNSLQTRPVVESGPYSYGRQLTLQCTVGDNTFEKYRFCTYNPSTDDYEMQGSQYECGVIDCGTPKQEPGSSYSLPAATTLGSFFEFTCESNTREGQTQAGSESRVFCLKDGYWDFGNLQCTGLKCLDPTYPPDGDIIAESFADKSTVKFKCLRNGYTLSNDVTLTCNRDTFFPNNEQVPTCVDTQKPVINNCPTNPISIRKYESLPPRLPQLTVTDNTAVQSFTIFPSNANTTYYVSSNLQVVYTATDFAGNDEKCIVNVEVTDEEPPLINCPSDRIVYMDTDNEEKTYDKLTLEDVIPVNQRSEINSFFVVGEPDIVRSSDLYKTYTFTIEVTDKAGNRANCQQQIFVQPRPCSEISYPTPLNAKKECTFSGSERTCTLTCDDSYTFEDGKTKVVRCSGGRWGNTPWIPACVLDVTPPVVTCPASTTISNLVKRGDTFEYEFATNLKIAVAVSDLNTYGDPQFIPEKYTFTETDLYKPKVVIVQVTDAAGNTGSCSFEYTAIPPACSELSLLAPIDGTVSGTRRSATNTRSAGWDVTITCNTGKILRNVGTSTTVSCNDGNAWSDADIFPICIDDKAGPTLSCPTSTQERISTGDDERRISFASDAKYAARVATDFSGIASRTYQPSFIDVNFNGLNTVKQITLTVTDNAGNPSSCSFQVAIIAEECSPLALPAPVNGNKACNQTANGWSCTVSCNPNYSFYSTTAETLTSSCQNGGQFNTYIPDCARDDDTKSKQFIGKFRYQYIPESDSVISIPSECTTSYKNSLSLGNPSVLDRMTTRLKSSCDTTYGPFNADFVFEFLLDDTDVTIQTDGRTVEMILSYTIVYSDTSIYEKCAVSFLDDIQKVGNTFPLSENIPANGNCPQLKWVKVFDAGSGPFCAAPFFASLTNDDQCVRCPAGTQSNGEVCSICPKGTYRSYADSSCIQCQAGYTTRYPGATNEGMCIAPCIGTTSTTGFAPCLTCQKGSYRLDSQTCQSCGFGQTTNGDGATSQADCVSNTIDDVPCTIGTQLNSNTGLCEPCPIGTYRSPNTASNTCVPCPDSGTSTYFRGATTSRQCYATCRQGFTSNTGLAPCRPCPIGEYSVSATECESCPTDFTTTYPGQYPCVPTSSLRIKCPRGTFRDINSQCVNCAEGTYNSNEEGTCISCLNTETTFFAGATARTMCRSKCPPGFYSSTGKAPCIPCGIGRYSSVYGATDCTPCSAANDMTTATTTSTSNNQCIKKCDEGYFSFSGFDQNAACRQCPRNYYQPQKGQTSCIQCSASSSYSTEVGLTSSTQCLSATTLCDNYCLNGGTCSIRNNEAVCDCTQGQYFGPRCSTAVDHCRSNPCYNNGICSSTLTGFTCDCRGFATGTRCETLVKTCQTGSNPTCKNGGHCINRLNSFECMCAEGYTGDTCEVSVNICNPSPCNAAGTLRCEDVSRGFNLRYRCVCRPGYTGEKCADDVDECASNPCINGGECRNLLNAFSCNCPSGYSGRFCEVRQDRCASNNCQRSDTRASCVDDYQMNKHMCICNSEYTYDAEGSFAQYQLHLNRAPTNLQDFTAETGVDTVSECRTRCTSLTTRCKWFAFNSDNNRCYIWNPEASLTLGTNANVNLFTKEMISPTDDFYTPRYSLKTPIPSSPSDSESLTTLRSFGLDICGGTEPLYMRCCGVGETCLDNRNLPGGLDCSQAQNSLTYLFANKDYDIQFKCSVSRVFSSFTCKLKNDYCAMLSPCQNGAACSDVFGGYRCSCQTGYTGKNCQTNINECAESPCLNGGTCEDQVIGYQCKCTEFYTGPNCGSPKQFCTADSCNNHGTCTNVPGSGYRCDCFSGYQGTDCETEINYCTSDPCQHDGTCNRRVGGYTCTCVSGWQGINCETPVQKCNDQLIRGRCQGACYNIFNDYSCECDANRFGSDCENVRDPCRDYNKCQNGGQCSYDTSMNCRCLTKYTGDGCQRLVDYCGKTNPCQNDAMCTVTDTGYTCTCKQGYEGVNCEKEVNDCPAEKCPNGGDCYDGVNTYYCRCPIQKTGTNCQKDVDVNYDLSFYHPNGYGFAWIPYYIQVSNANYISVTLWVRYSSNGDTGVYMTQFVGDRFEDAFRFMEFEERGVKIYIDQPNSDHVLLEYDREAVLNDGNWHLVALTCDMIKGTASLNLDTIAHATVTDDNLIMPDSTFRQWVVLGCEFDTMERRCMMDGKGFRGYISQVNWYTRLLSFEGPDDSTVGDIPTIFINPQYVFGDLNYLLLAWNEYVYESGVGKMTPSEANGTPCSNNNRNPACRSYRATSKLPSVTNCPTDKVIYSEDRITSVTWEEPEFNNFASVMRPSRPPGSSFTWGIYRMTYIATDGANNKAYCHFTIYVNAGRCNSNPDPQGGDQTCNTRSDRTDCMISCPNTYRIDRSHPDLFTCGPTSFWNSDKPFRQFRYPSCGLIKPIPKVEAYIRVNYRMLTAACSAAQTNIRNRVYEELRKMDAQFDGLFCQQADCSEVKVQTTCLFVNQGKRRRRQTSSFTNFLLEITLPLIDQRVEFDEEIIYSKEFLTYFILGAGVLNFDTIPNLTFLKENFEIVMTEKCPEGEVLRDGQCVECGPGNYFRYTDNTNMTGICDDCPLGYYQDLSGAKSCKQCTTGLTTELTGEYLASSCKTSCPIGQYFDKNRNSCQPCPIGYYQDEVGQFRCKGCGAGETTKETGSTSSQDCSVSCDSGSELNNNGGCDLCEIGFYRDAATSRICLSCNEGFITAAKGAKTEADCNIVDCPTGNYRDEANNECRPCPLNTYQDEIRMTSCKSCGNAANYRTASTGSSSQSQCLYYCPSGFEVNLDTGNTCDICPVEEYKDNNIDPQGRCITCPGNKVSPTQGAKSAGECTIYKCLKGYSANAANTACDSCDIGYYQDEVYSTECKKCPTLTSTRQQASNSSTDCEMYCLSGQEMINGVCRSCKVGFYKDNADGVFEPCKQCNSRYTTASVGSTSSSDCNIRTCPAGTKRDATDTGCDPCPRGTYQPDAFQKDCLPCDSGTSTRTLNSTKKSDCEIYCSSGFHNISGECKRCERGYFKDNNIDVFSLCTLCPLEYITENEAAISESLCVVANCSAGQYRQPNNICAPCPKGQYQPEKWQSFCFECGPDKTTETDGASNSSECIVECSPGFEDINGVCRECPRGTYKVERAAAKCKPCPTGFTTVGTGATSTSLCTLPACTAGQYLDKVTDPNNPVCKPCAYDFYQNEIWQEQCKPCQDNKVTLSTGADEATDCVLDCGSGLQYNSNTGACEFCPRGYYRNKNDRLQPQCVMCPIDKLTPGEGGKDITECTDANCTIAGEYRDTSSNTCQKCPIGTYNSEKWVTSCRDCPLGNSTRTVGATSIGDCRSICPLGQYVGPSNACELCPRGTYRSNAATDVCAICPNGLTTEEEGADSESQCRISPCLAGSKYVNNRACVECEEGTYQPNNGSFQCIDCPFSIKYTPTTGATSEDQCRSPCEAGKQFDVATKSCFPCPIGTFQPQSFQFTCLQCPQGRKFTSKIGSTTIDSCLSYCSVSTANQCSVNATCTVSDTNVLGYTCTCFTNYESVGQVTGRECVHKCDRGYCKNGATCVREPQPSCTCSKWYKGDTCETRLKAEELSDDTLDIVIPVSIAVGGLILFLIILAVCCLCWRRGPSKGPEPQYSEFNGERYDKGSTHSFTMPYNSRPPSRLMMLQPAHEIVYDNKAYMTDSHSVIDTSMIDAAVYEA